MTARRTRQGFPATLPGEIAGAAALFGLMLGMAAFVAEALWLGVAGLFLVGIALGFTGSLSWRVRLAVSIWLAGIALTGVSVMVGSKGFVLIAPVVFCLLFVATGQLIGMLAGILLLHDGTRGRETTPRSTVK